MEARIIVKDLAEHVKSLSNSQREVCAIRNYLGLRGEQLLDHPLKRKVPENPAESFGLYFALDWETFDDIVKFFELTPEQKKSAELKCDLLIALREKMRKQRLTHEAAAEIAEVPRSALTAILGGNVEGVSLDRILSICLKLGVNWQFKVLKN